MSLKRLGAVCLTLAVAAPLAAQQGQNQGRGMRMQSGQHSMQGGQQRAQGPEKLLTLRKTLELTEDQVVQLETLQEGFAEQQKARRAQAQEMREQVRSGDVTRNEMREQATARRESGQQISAAHKQMIEQVLTEEQRGKLTEIRAAGRNQGSGQAGRRGQGQQGRHQGMKGGRGHKGGQQGPPNGRGGNGGR